MLITLSILLFVGITAGATASYIGDWRIRSRRKYLVHFRDGGVVVVGPNLHRSLKRAGVVKKTVIL